MINELVMELANNTGCIRFTTTYTNAEKAFKQFYSTCKMNGISIDGIAFADISLFDRNGKKIHTCDLHMQQTS